jgi:hypothetical protein
VSSQQQQQQQLGERPRAVYVLVNSLAVGFGIGLVFGIMRLFFQTGFQDLSNHNITTVNRTA